MILYINTKDSGVVKATLKDKGQEIECLKTENKFGSQALLPLIMEILKRNKQDFKDLEGIELEIGPGSFTGLRVGAAVAQTLSFALNIPLNGIVNKHLHLSYT